ncbi:hypothetical protein NEOLEDRAFT_1179584 [Neolentinus lepideus HHB14362 ss-1]|uniref:Uncharacterized protein n=1 Tax=Neolentinus lepideus HHB14362 ss-1 TaxID=1314782 RepID=A0A165RNT7_9AGAM|nr:hypothetical protein NEOLEDRAFT_1179584 [Neolentinus lepideus HHB14362 ss-1]
MTDARIGRKRAAAEEGSGPTTRASKAAKTEGGAAAPKGKGGKRGPKTNLAASAFKANALPLHVNLTHTPPSVGDKDTEPATAADPGFIGSLTLVPSSFQTGSYGWKGTKRIQVEISNPEGGGQKETVHVQLQINATVIGSKDAPSEEHPETSEEAKEEATEKANGNDEAKEEAEKDEEAAEQ